MSNEDASSTTPSTSDSVDRSSFRHAASAGLGIVSTLATVMAIAERGFAPTLLGFAFVGAVVGFIWVWEKNKRIIWQWSAPLAVLALVTGVGFLWIAGTTSDRTDDTTMPRPTRLTAHVIDSTQLELSWRDHSADEDGFLVYDTTQGLVAQLPADTHTYTIQDLPPETWHCYVVVAVRGDAESDRSNEVCHLTPSEAGDTTRDDEVAEEEFVLIVEGNFGTSNPLFTPAIVEDFSVGYDQNVLELRSLSIGAGQRKFLSVLEVPEPVSISVEMRTISESDGDEYAGTYLYVACRWSVDSDNLPSGYALEIDPEFRTAWLARLDAGVRLELASYQEMSAISPTDEWQSVWLLCADDTITAWINDRSLSVEDGTYTDGAAVIGAGTFTNREDGRVGADFRNLSI